MNHATTHSVSERVRRRDAQAKQFGLLSTAEKIEILRICRVVYPILHDRITRLIPFVFWNKNPIARVRER